MEIKEIVESIVREVVQTMQQTAAAQPKVLYIFGDSAAHEGLTDQFIFLQNHGIRHDILFLDGEASAWLGMHKIETGGTGKIIAADEFAPAPIELPLEYDGIVIPEIDLDNLGRATLGMKGTVIAEIIFSALVLGKFVLLGGDSPGLKRADRRTLKTLELPAAYRKLFDYYKKELAYYGAEFAPRDRLAELAASKCGGIGTEQGTPKGTAAKAEDVPGGKTGAAADETSPGGSLTFEGRLVTAEWVKAQTRGKRIDRLSLGKGTILSPLAKDMLKEKGISVQYVNER